jgi:chromosome segregation ATPase
MSRSHKVLGFLFVSMLGLYGCARGPAAGSTGDRAALDAKIQRLEEDFRSAASARDAFRQRLLAAEDKLAQVQKSLDQAKAATVQERRDRDSARAELTARTRERDSLQTQYDGFRKNIKELLGTAEAALTSPSSPNQSVAVGANIRN